MNKSIFDYFHLFSIHKFSHLQLSSQQSQGILGNKFLDYKHILFRTLAGNNLPLIRKDGIQDFSLFFKEDLIRDTFYHICKNWSGNLPLTIQIYHQFIKENKEFKLVSLINHSLTYFNSQKFYGFKNPLLYPPLTTDKDKTLFNPFWIQEYKNLLFVREADLKLYPDFKDFFSFIKKWEENLFKHIQNKEQPYLLPLFYNTKLQKHNFYYILPYLNIETLDQLANFIREDLNKKIGDQPNLINFLFNPCEKGLAIMIDLSTPHLPFEIHDSFYPENVKTTDSSNASIFDRIIEALYLKKVRLYRGKERSTQGIHAIEVLVWPYKDEPLAKISKDT